MGPLRCPPPVYGGSDHRSAPYHRRRRRHGYCVQRCSCESANKKGGQGGFTLSGLPVPRWVCASKATACTFMETEHTPLQLDLRFHSFHQLQVGFCLPRSQMIPSLLRSSCSDRALERCIIMQFHSFRLPPRPSFSRQRPSVHPIAL
eukprot:scaffold13083_cov155-Skeletonema_dohrnii-CCMP3373.AAC.1